MIACDGAPEGLREFVQSVTNQSVVGGFELRVVELVPHVLDAHPGVLLLPNVPVRTEIVARTAVNITIAEGQARPGVEVKVTPQDEIAASVRQAESGASKEMRPGLAEAVVAYDAIADAGYETRGRASSYRQVKPPTWPGPVHYEFGSYGGGDVGLELHVENEAVQPLRATLEPMARGLARQFPGMVSNPLWRP